MYTLALSILDAGLLITEGDYLIENDNHDLSYNYPLLKERIDTFGENYSQPFAKILEQMLLLDPNNRPNFEALAEILPRRPSFKESNGNADK